MNDVTITQDTTAPVQIVLPSAGPRGPQGLPGLAGLQGPPGASSTMFNGTGAPPTTTGVTGDYYFRTDTADVYWKTAPTTWANVANIRGARGATWLQASGVPGSGLGLDGDFYFRTDTSDVYFKVAGSWGAPIINLKGATGATGAAGANGATWYQASGAPASGLGVNGDFYFRTDTADVYQKSAGSWGAAIANLKGPSGAGVSPRGFIAGMLGSAPGGGKVVSVTTGVCRDSSNAQDIVFASGMTFTGTTTGANGMDTGATPAGGTIHLYAIAQSGGANPAVLGSITAPGAWGVYASTNMPAGYVYSRRFLSVTTDGSGNVRKFLQDADRVQHGAAIQEVGTSPGTTAAILQPATGCPNGIRVRALMRVMVDVASASSRLLVWGEDPTDAVSSTNFTAMVSVAAGVWAPGTVEVQLGSDRGFHYQVDSAGGVPFISTIAYYDDRHKNG